MKRLSAAENASRSADHRGGSHAVRLRSFSPEKDSRTGMADTRPRRHRGVSGFPAVSVVLPVHNGMPYFEHSVRSILAQSFGNFELVIGDDGSDDGTGEAALRLAAGDPRIRVLRRERPSGLAASANWVVGEARAPLVAIAHADDRSYAQRIERQVAVLDAHADIDLVGALWDGMDEEGRIVRVGDFWRLLTRSPFAPFAHSSIMFRRSAFHRVGGYRPQADYWEDLDLYFRVAANGGVAVVPEVLSTVRHARISTRLRDDQARVEDAVDLMFRAVAEQATGRPYDPLFLRPRAGAAGKVHPMTFVSLGSTRLWSGRSPRVLGRMRRRARLGLDGASLHAACWVLWATASPRTLRAFLQIVLVLRNFVAKPLAKRRSFVEWPFRPASVLHKALEAPRGGRPVPS